MFSLQRVKSATKVSPIVLRRLSRSQDNESSNTDLISTPSSIVRSSRLALSFAPSTSSDEEEETAQDGDIQVEYLRKCLEFSFHKAAAEGDIESLHSFLSEDTSDPDILDDRGFAALHHAARGNHVHAVNLLLDFGANVDVRDESGNTPLFYAIRNNGIDAMDTLIARRANINLQIAANGVTLVTFAIFSGTKDIIHRLLNEKKCDVNLQYSNGVTPMHAACIMGILDVCESLLRLGAYTEARTAEDMTPLHFAASNADAKIVELLIKSVNQSHAEYPMHVLTVEHPQRLKEFVNSRDLRLNSPLHVAAQAGNVPVIKVLLQYGADINAMNSNLKTPVHLAAFNGWYETLGTLISRGAKVNLRDEKQRTALHSAVLSGNKGSVSFLIANGAEVDARDSDGLTPFLTAVAAGQIDCVSVLLKSKADVMARDKKMRSCLHLAVQKEREMVLELLLRETGTEIVNLPDWSDRTPLHYAAMTTDVKILHLLLEHRSVCHIKDFNHKTPLHLAAEMGKARHVEALCRASLSCPSQQDNLKRTALHHAVINKKKKAASIIIGMGADANTPDIHGWTPLLWSAISGSVSIAKLLLDHHVNADHMDNDGNTAIHLAAYHGHVEIVKLLLDYGAVLLVNNSGLMYLDVAMEQNNKDVVMAVVKHDRWREVLSPPTPNSPHPMGTLIARFPAAAAVVMDHCIQRSSTPSRHPKVSITYDFRLLDPGPKTNGERFFGLLKMVTHRQENLLMHALSRKLLETKWSVFGSYFYWFNFCMYVLFLAFLTSFILVQRSVVALPDPGSRNTTVENEKMFFENKGFNEIIPYIVAVFAVLHLAKEIVSIYMQRVRYFFLITNLLEWALYVMALIFMLPFLIPDTGLRSHPEAYWQMGTCAIFLGYLNFILFLRTFDYFGLYVTMFFEVFTTMVKAMIVFSLFVLAFSMVFYILFKEEEMFANFGLAIMKVSVMTIGEFEYSDFLVDSVGKLNKISNAPLVPYPEFSYVFFYIFLLAMPIVLMNLLVGLAVGDIEAIRKTAFLSNKARKIDFVTEFEDSLPECIARRLYRPQVCEDDAKPDQKKCGKFLEHWNKEEVEPMEDENEARLVALQQDVTKTKQKMKGIMTSLAQQREILMAVASNIGVELQTDRE